MALNASKDGQFRSYFQRLGLRLTAKYRTRWLAKSARAGSMFPLVQRRSDIAAEVSVVGSSEARTLRVVGKTRMAPYSAATPRNNALDPQTCAAKGATPAPMVLIAPLIPQAQGTNLLSSETTSTSPCGNR